MPTHRMHLKGPWEYEVLGVATALESAAESHAAPNVPATRSDVPLTGTVRMPSAWQDVFGTFRGSIRFQRRFHAPTNLDEHEKVFVVFDGIGGTACVAMNDTLLGEIPRETSTAEFDITRLLEKSNRLRVEIRYNGATDQNSPQGGLWGPVALEIRSD